MTQPTTQLPHGDRPAKTLATLVQSFSAWLDRRRLGLCCGVLLAIEAAIFLFLAFTRTGKAMRAVADNPTLANVKGVDADRVGQIVNFVGMGLAGVGGMLLGLDTSIDPLTGFRVILSVFAAAVVGGLGSIPGAVVGALTIGVAEELSLVALAPAYRTAVGFVAILFVLTLRPRGILGERAY